MEKPRQGGIKQYREGQQFQKESGDMDWAKKIHIRKKQESSSKP